MRTVVIAARCELLRMVRMRSVMILLFGLPLMLIFLLGNALDMEMKPVKTIVRVEDQGMLRSHMDAFFSSDTVDRMLDVTYADSKEAVLDTMRNGASDYGVFVPADFSAQVMKGEEANWIYYPGRFSERNLAAETVMNAFLNEVRAVQSAAVVLGPEEVELHGITAVGGQGGQPSLVDAGLVGNGGSRAFGPVSSMQYYASAMLIMFIMFSGMSAALSLLEEKENRTLHRLYAMPSPFGMVISGKLLGVMLFSVFQAMTILGFTKFVYGVEWGNDLGMITLIVILTVISASSLGLIVASFTRRSKPTETVFSLMTFVMTFLSGGMVADMGEGIQTAGKFTLNYWASDSLRTLMSGQPTGETWHEVGILALIAAGCALAAGWRLKKVVAVHE